MNLNYRFNLRRLIIPACIGVVASAALLPWDLPGKTSLGLNAAYGSAASAGGGAGSGDGAGSGADSGDAAGSAAVGDNGSNSDGSGSETAASAKASAEAAQSAKNSGDAASATASMSGGFSPGAASGQDSADHASTQSTGGFSSGAASGEDSSDHASTQSMVGFSPGAASGEDSTDHASTQTTGGFSPGAASGEDSTTGGYSTSSTSTSDGVPGGSTAATDAQTTDAPSGSFFSRVAAGFMSVSNAIDNSTIGSFINAHFSPETTADANPVAVAASFFGLSRADIFGGINAEAESLGPTAESVVATAEEVPAVTAKLVKAVEDETPAAVTAVENLWSHIDPWAPEPVSAVDPWGFTDAEKTALGIAPAEIGPAEIAAAPKTLQAQVDQINSLSLPGVPALSVETVPNAYRVTAQPPSEVAVAGLTPNPKAEFGSLLDHVTYNGTNAFASFSTDEHMEGVVNNGFFTNNMQTVGDIATSYQYHVNNLVGVNTSGLNAASAAESEVVGVGATASQVDSYRTVSVNTITGQVSYGSWTSLH